MCLPAGLFELAINNVERICGLLILMLLANVVVVVLEEK